MQRTCWVWRDASDVAATRRRLQHHQHTRQLQRTTLARKHRHGQRMGTCATSPRRHHQCGSSAAGNYSATTSRIHYGWVGKALLFQGLRRQGGKIHQRAETLTITTPTVATIALKPTLAYLANTRVRSPCYGSTAQSLHTSQGPVGTTTKWRMDCESGQAPREANHIGGARNGKRQRPANDSDRCGWHGKPTALGSMFN